MSLYLNKGNQKVLTKGIYKGEWRINHMQCPPDPVTSTVLDDLIICWNKKQNKKKC